MTLDQLRADLLTQIEKHGDAARFHQGQLATVEAALAAHDAAVEAMRAELATTPSAPAPGTRVSRRNIPDEVYARLNSTPQSVDALVEAIPGTRVPQIQAAILKLGEKAVSESDGYVRRYDGATDE